MNLRKRYIIEYIDNERDLDYLNSGRVDDGEPWERFKKKVFEEEKGHSVYTGADGIDGKAWSTFMMWSLAPEQINFTEGDRITHPLFCQMWQEFVDENGEVVYEDFCELPSTTANTFRKVISGQLDQDLWKERKRSQTLRALVDMHEEFLENCEVKPLFLDYLKKNGRYDLYDV